MGVGGHPHVDESYLTIVLTENPLQLLKSCSGSTPSHFEPDLAMVQSPFFQNPRQMNLTNGNQNIEAISVRPPTGGPIKPEF